MKTEMEEWVSSTDKPTGIFTRRTACRFCRGTGLTKVLDLGKVPLAGGFLGEKDFPEEKFYPLTLDFCRDCSLVQVGEVVSADVLFKGNYFFFSSAIKTLVDHFREFAAETHERFLKGTPNPSVLEIGCNDGVLLKPLSALGVRCIGVDPAENVVKTIDSKEIAVFNDYFTERLALRIREKYGRLDAILSSYSFAHIDDMEDVMQGIKCLLKDDGIFIFEIYYLGTLIEEMQYDMIYHEHMSYYSLTSLTAFFRRHGMEIFDVKHIPGVRSGSVRFYSRNVGRRKEGISPAVGTMMRHERELGFDGIDVYARYAEKVDGTRDRIVRLLDRLKRENRSIVGYGASGRGTIIMNYCGIDRRYIDYVIDDAPAKHGFFTPGTHLPIRPWEYAVRSGFPDYMVLFAWAFTEEILKKRQDYLKQGGKFILPLPEVRIVSG